MLARLFVFLALLAAMPTPLVADQTYFPPGVWGPVKKGSRLSVAEQDALYEEWFGGYLAAARESPLWVQRAQTGATESLRVMVMPSWRGPSILRVDMSGDGTARFVFKRLLHEGNGPQGLAETTAGTVPPALLDDIRIVVDQIAPTTDRTPSQTGECCGFDGTTAVFEFSAGTTYNAMQRWSGQVRAEDPLLRLYANLMRLGPPLPPFP
jgi:hypothetical protein